MSDKPMMCACGCASKVHKAGSLYYTACPACWAKTPYCKDEAIAIKAWNAMQKEAHEKTRARYEGVAG